MTDENFDLNDPQYRFQSQYLDRWTDTYNTPRIVQENYELSLPLGFGREWSNGVMRYQGFDYIVETNSWTFGVNPFIGAASDEYVKVYGTPDSLPGVAYGAEWSLGAGAGFSIGAGNGSANTAYAIIGPDYSAALKRSTTRVFGPFQPLSNHRVETSRGFFLDNGGLDYNSYSLGPFSTGFNDQSYNGGSAFGGVINDFSSSYSNFFQYTGLNAGSANQNYGFSTGFNDQSYNGGSAYDYSLSNSSYDWGSSYSNPFQYSGYTGGANNNYGFSTGFNDYSLGGTSYNSNYISDPSAPYSSLFGSGSSYDWGASYSTPTSSYDSNPFSYSGYTGGGSSNYGYSTGFDDFSYSGGSSYDYSSSYSSSSYDYGSSSSSYISDSSWSSSYSDTFTYSGYTGGSSSYGGSSSGSWGSWGWPVVLDLDGDGVELVTLDQSPAFFDFDEDSYQENSVCNTAWVSSTGAEISAANDNQASLQEAA